MNSIAQQAVTNGYGNSENLRAQPTSSSFLVVRYSKRRRLAAVAGRDRDRAGAVAWRYSVTAFEQPRLVDVEQDQHQQEDEEAEREQHEAGQRLRAERPDEQEHGLEVEQDEDDGDRVVLDRHRLDVQRGRPASRRTRTARAWPRRAGFGPSSRFISSVSRRSRGSPAGTAGRRRRDSSRPCGLGRLRCAPRRFGRTADLPTPRFR